METLWRSIWGWQVPRPIRQTPASLIATGLCRAEVQKVLRKHHSTGDSRNTGNASGFTCLSMFGTLAKVRSPDFHALAEKGRYRKITTFQFLGYLIASHPKMFGELLIAVVNSEKRLQQLNPDSPERIIEENFPALSNVEGKRKLNEALPGISEGKLAQVRDRLSKANRITAYWSKAANLDLPAIGRNTRPLARPKNGDILFYCQ